MPPEPIVDPDALRAARTRAGLTQHELARLIGVAGGERVSRWELGASTPRPGLLRRVAGAVGVDVSELLLPAVGPADLRRLRFLAGLSARELAVSTHMSTANLNRWEAGRIERAPSRAALEPVAAALAVTVEDVERALATGRANARSLTRRAGE